MMLSTSARPFPPDNRQKHRLKRAIEPVRALAIRCFKSPQRAMLPGAAGTVVLLWLSHRSELLEEMTRVPVAVSSTGPVVKCPFQLGLSTPPSCDLCDIKIDSHSFVHETVAELGCYD